MIANWEESAALSAADSSETAIMGNLAAAPRIFTPWKNWTGTCAGSPA